MEICEVYALNIQPSQLKAVLSTDKHNSGGFEEERMYFLGWLKEQYSLGLRYNSQVDAWFWYKLAVDVSLLEDDDEWEPDWMSRIKFALEEKVLANQRNYSEFGGQQ
jgi:hypothetical protein